MSTFFLMVLAFLAGAVAGLVLGWLVWGRSARAALEESDTLWRQRLTMAEGEMRALRGGGAAPPAAAAAPSPDNGVEKLRESLLQAQSERAAALAELDRLRAAAAPAPASDSAQTGAASPAAATSGRMLPSEAAAQAADTGIPPAEPGAAPDDLKRIKGIGPKLEKTLNGLGVYTLAQIAAWDDAQVAAVDERLDGFRGRIARDRWIRQAKALMNAAN